jgi:alkylhydroperoxidase/carboxymuconolactone decarboxylase family protein YurZ
MTPKSTSPTASPEELRQAWIEVHGRFDSSAEELLRHDPAFFAHMLDFTAHAWRHGPLEPKVKALILLAADSAVTHLDHEGALANVRLARALGASPAEIVETLELTSTIGVHAALTAVPILLEELEAAGRPLDLEAPLSAEERALKERFVELRGYWNPFWDGILRLDPEFFSTYTELSGYRAAEGTLGPLTRELLCCAFDSSSTHMFTAGLRQHIATALELGATAEELMEVFELVSGIGMLTFGAALPALGADSA